MGAKNAYVGTMTRAAHGQQVTGGTLAADAPIGAAGPAAWKVATGVPRYLTARSYCEANAPWLGTGARLYSELRCIDDSQPVTTETWMPAQKFTQCQPTARGQGNYSANMADGPSGLGVKTAGRVRTDYVATTETRARRSTARTVTVDGEGPAEVAAGGRTQSDSPEKAACEKAGVQ